MAYLQDRRADLHQIIQQDGKLAAIEKLCFWFLNSFGGRRKVHNVTFSALPAGSTFTKQCMAGKRIYLSRKESCLIMAEKVV